MESSWRISNEDIQLTTQELELGKGGMVVGVFREQKVAVMKYNIIKSEHNLAVMNREIDTMSRLLHPNLLLFIGAVLDHPSGNPLIITEIMDTSLRQAYEKGQLTNDETSKLSILRDTASGLGYLHCHEIIYRDVSSASVLLKSRGPKKWRAKLSSFGTPIIARQAYVHQIGAAVYVAPEIFVPLLGDDQKLQQQTTKMDVYSYGVLSCEVMCCQFPESHDMFRTMLSRVHNSSPSIGQMIQDCVNKSPQQRPTMAHIIHHLDDNTSHDSQDNTETPTATESTAYAPYLEKAASKGTVITRQSSLGLCGAAGTGKTSTLRLITDQPPVDVHDSTPILKPEEYFHNDDKVHSIEPSEDDDWDSDKELDPPTQSPTKQQTVPPVKQVLLISNETSTEWKPATQEVMLERLANCTVTALELEKMANERKAKRSCLLIEGFAMTKNEKLIERDPIDKPLVNDDNGATPKLLSKQSSASSSACNEISEKILKFIESNKTLKPLGITHFISTCDTGGQAAFLDVAPAFIRYNSVNLIFLKLDENLDDPAQFFYSVKGVRVGDEKRQVSTQALVRSFVSSKSKIRKPSVKGMKVIQQPNEKPKFMILGTHFDKYKQKIGGCQSKEEKNQVLREDLVSFGDCLYPNSKTKIMFSLDTLARDKATKMLASKIRKLVMENYTEAEIPVSWYIFQLAMFKVKSSNENQGMIRLSTLIDIGTITRMPREEVEASLLYFHDLHVCLYFPTVVPNVVFTNPQFLFDKISEIIAYTFSTKIKIGTTDNESQKLAMCGIFTQAFLKKVCKGFTDDFFSSKDFLALMSHLFVVCSLPGTDQYFMPCVLATHPSPCEDFSKCSVKPLALTWDKSVPNGLFPSLTTKIQAHDGINSYHFTMSRVEQQYRNRITLHSVDIGCKVMLVECTSFIAASINTCIPQTPDSDSSYVKVRGVILRCINDIVNRLDWVQAEPEECFICDMCPSECPVHLCYPNQSLTVLSCSMTETTTELTVSHLAWRKGKGLTSSTQLTMESVFNFLKTKSSQWDSIGAAFGIPFDARQSLRHDPSINDSSRLEHVLAKWLESSTPTWSDFMNVLIHSLKFNDVAEHVKSLVSDK